jgi:hypothetical protein
MQSKKILKHKIMSNIIQIGATYLIKDLTATHDKLPLGVYLTQYNDNTGEYSLVAKEQFKLPKKIYGDYSIVKRWLKSWKHNSEKNMGILLSGTKGTGKTITAQKFCIEAKMPVIIVDSPHGGGYAKGFNNFISNPVFNNSIVFIDEFEKIYQGRDEQSELLGLLDGAFMTKLIFLLTVNENNLNDYLNNRLNRIKYHKAYGDLETEIVEEVIEDLLVNKEHKDSIYKFFKKVNMCTFDLLVNVIKEMNLFNEDAITCGAHLNLTIQEKIYAVYELFDGKEHKCDDIKLSPGKSFGDNDRFYIHRKNTDYLKTIKNDNIGFGKVKSLPTPSMNTLNENSSAWNERYTGWEVHLSQSECEITYNDKNLTILHKSSGLRFRLEELPNYLLVF